MPPILNAIWSVFHIAIHSDKRQILFIDQYKQLHEGLFNFLLI